MRHDLNFLKVLDIDHQFPSCRDNAGVYLFKSCSCDTNWQKHHDLEAHTPNIETFDGLWENSKGHVSNRHQVP